MSRFFGPLVVALSLLGPAASAGDKPKPEEPQQRAEDEQQPADDREQPARPRTQIRVLESPHDLASFYRADGAASRVPAGAPLSAYYTNSQGGRGYYYEGYGYGYGNGYGVYGARGYYRAQDADQCVSPRPVVGPYGLAARYRK